MADKPDWAREGAGWPNAERSRFVRAGGLDWHVQIAGEGPVCLLLHGTAAATHSWRAILPKLAERFTVAAPDLPGHGFTATPPARAMTPPAMALGVAALMEKLALQPALIVGHSAGAAIAAQGVIDGRLDPKAIVAFNGAFLPIGGGEGGEWASWLAKALFLNPIAPRLFAWRGSDARAVDRLLKGTGSDIDEEGRELYRRLVARSGHVAGALTMMAQWDLPGLKRRLPGLKTPLVLITGENDKAVPPRDAERVAGLVPTGEVILQPGLGHLSHEERPEEAVRLILEAAERHGALS